MVKKSTIAIGCMLFLVAGVGAYFALTVWGPKETAPANTATVPATNESTDEVIDDEDTTEDLVVAQQDVAVKNILASIASGMVSYASNNRGVIVQTDAQLAAFTTTYLADVDLTNPATETAFQISLTSQDEEIIFYQPGHTCDGPGTSRQFALTTTLPSGAVYCIDS